MRIQDTENQEIWQQLPTQQQMQVGEAAVAPAPAASSKEPVPIVKPASLYKEDESDLADTDTKKGTPAKTKVLGADDDDASATTDTEENESDIDDDTPDDDESDEGGYEKRFKDTQAKLTETAQELAQVRAETAEAAANLQRLEFEYQDRMQQQEQIAGYLNNKASARLNHLRQFNPQTMNQEQFTRWRNDISIAEQEAQATHNDIQQIQQRVQQAREEALQRESAVARKFLTTRIANFDNAYPEIMAFAESKGVSSKLIREVTDPGLIMLLYEAMQAATQPDVIEKVTTSRQTPQRSTPNARSRTGNAKPKTLAEKMYGSN